MNQNYNELNATVPDTVMSYKALKEILKFYARESKEVTNSKGISDAFLINPDMCVILGESSRGPKEPLLKIIRTNGIEIKPEFLNDLLRDGRVHLDKYEKESLDPKRIYDQYSK